MFKAADGRKQASRGRWVGLEVILHLEFSLWPAKQSRSSHWSSHHPQEGKFTIKTVSQASNSKCTGTQHTLESQWVQLTCKPRRVLQGYAKRSRYQGQNKLRVTSRFDCHRKQEERSWLRPIVLESNAFTSVSRICISLPLLQKGSTVPTGEARFSLLDS